MNKNAGKLISLIVSGVVMSTVGMSNAYAKEVCFTQYGGGETCVNVEEETKIKVDKKIYNPKTGSYEDNISSNSYKYAINDEIMFSINIKNDGDVEIQDIKLIDVLPEIIKYKSSDKSANQDGSKVTFDIGDLQVGEETSVTIKVEVKSDGILPDDSEFCLTNVANAEGKANGADESDFDLANFCIELPKVLGKEKVVITSEVETPKELPKTGAGLNLVLGALSIFTGLVLRKKVVR